MRTLLRNFWREEDGCVLAMEWVFVASILTLATLAGLLALRHAEDLGTADWPATLTR
jgi:Flp pilus assembly pilin Flp